MISDIALEQVLWSVYNALDELFLLSMEKYNINFFTQTLIAVYAI
jgi:hypothetical protein